MNRNIFETLTDFVDHLGVTGSILLALGFALVMFLLRSLADKGEEKQSKTQKGIEVAESMIETHLIKESKIPEYYIIKFPFSVLKICNKHKRIDLITSELKWHLFKNSVLLIIFLAFYFAIIGFIIFAIMRGLKKI